MGSSVVSGSSQGHVEPLVMCMLSVWYSVALPSFFLLCHPHIEETNRLVLWNFPCSALMIILPLLSSWHCCSLLTPGAGSFFPVHSGCWAVLLFHPPGTRNIFLPNQVMTTKSVLWGRITEHDSECNSVPYSLASCEPVAGPGRGFHKSLPITSPSKALLHG